jgi:hypothetical protein
LALTACTQGVDGAESFTFGPPETASGDPIDNQGTTGTTDPTQGSDGVSDSAVPTTGIGESGATTDDPGSTGMGESSDTAPGGCVPGEIQNCYGGPEGTADVGACSSGSQTCQDDGTWGACEGDVGPSDEDCNGIDDDCDGTVDNGNPDGGDACNTGLAGPCEPGVLTCVLGELVCEGNVSPAAAETGGKNIDDDCTGVVDDGCDCDPGNPAADCAAGQSCFPVETFGDPAVCAGPMGAGGQYATCTDNSDCAPGHVCVDTGGNVYCMQWCTSFTQCPNALDDCVELDPTVWDENQEWGVCYDGLG